MADPHGTLRRSLEGFAHAIKLEQGPGHPSWEVIDVYGAMELLNDEEVSGWPIVYTPQDDDAWEKQV